MTVSVFLLVSVVPRDPVTAVAGADATPEQIAAVREQLHLDDPLPVRYARWVGDVVTLDLGRSNYTGRPVASELAQRLPVTASLVLGAAVVAGLLGLTLGITAGMRRGRWSDAIARFISSLGLATPNFVLGIALIILCSVKFKILPSIGYVKFTTSPTEWLRHIVLPSLTLGFGMAAVLIRQLRAGLIDTLGSNYVRAAWARGGTRQVVVRRHALRNGSMPAITVLGIQLAQMLGGTVIVEQIFSIPGIGTYLLNAAVFGDVPAIQGVTVLLVAAQLVMSLLVDILYGFLNPKIRVS